MPYKDVDRAREAARLRKQKQRMSHPENVTPSMSHPKLAKNIPAETHQNVNPVRPLVVGLVGVKALSAIRKLPVYNPNVTGFHPAPKVNK